MSTYIALIRKEPDSDFGVDFPDFPGCVTAGSSLDEARAMAEEALRFHVEGMLEDGESLPEPQSLEVIMADSDNREAVAFLVHLPRSSTRTVRVNFTMPEATLRRIDDMARAAGVLEHELAGRSTREWLADLRDEAELTNGDDGG